MSRFLLRNLFIIVTGALALAFLHQIAVAGQIKLGWDPPADPRVTGYKVYYGTASKSYGISVDVGNVTAYTLTGLTAGQTHFISVTSYDALGDESIHSNEVSGVAKVPCTVGTSRSGLGITVDGSSYPAPYTFSWVPGTSHTLSVASPQSGSSGTRYVYSSWSDGGGQSHSITAPSSGTTYTATFTTQYNLTTSANPSGGGGVSPSGTNWYNSGQSVSVSVTANAGYGFGSWSGDLSGSTNPQNITMSGPQSVTANFTQKQYTLAVGVSPSGSGSVAKSPNKAAYVYGDVVMLTASANTGYSFNSWSGDISGSTNPYALTINGNKNVTASFVAVGVLSVTPSGGLSSSGYQGGPFSPGSQTYTLQNMGGSSINWSAAKTQGWMSLSATSGSLALGASTTVVVSINGGANSLAAGSYSDTVTFSNVTNGNGNTTRSVRLTVNVPVQTYTVATSPVGLQVSADGTVYTAPQTFSWAVGSSHTVSVASPQSGSSGTRYVYSSWSDGGGQSHSITAPSSSTTYTATFTTQYNLTTSANPSGGGGVSPSGTNWYNSGQSVSVSATANAGYGFGSWSGDLLGSTNPQNITMSGPKSVTANFTQNQYTLAVGVSPSGSGSVAKSPNKAAYVYGDVVMLTASANTGYSFSSWSGDISGSTNPYALTINGNNSVTANFAISAENVSTPGTPTGARYGVTGASYTYSTGGSSSNLGHSVEYQLDWKGDGSDLSPWGSSIQSKVWSTAGSCSVRARARCVSDTGVVSSWSSPLAVVISPAAVLYTVTSNPSGLHVAVDGSSYTAPRTFGWIPGASHTISVASPQSGPSGTQYIYSSWSDGGGQSHSITAPSSSTTYTATFGTQYTLAAPVSASGGGGVSPSGTNWYNSGQSVSVSATVNAGYSFSGWSGDLLGSTNPCSLTMSGPKTVVANFSLIPETALVSMVPSGPGAGIGTIRGKPSIHFTSPGCGRSLRIGTSRRISWVSENLNLSGVIHLSYWNIDGWREIAQLPSTATSYYWTIPNLPAALTFLRIGNWIGDTPECESAIEIGFAISSNEEPSIEGGWVFDISQGDKGGVAVWFEENKAEGYGISAKYGMFKMGGEYTIDAEGVISGNFILYDFNPLVEIEKGHLLGKPDRGFRNLTFVMQTTKGEGLSLFTMKGHRIFGEQVFAKEWTAEMTGQRKGTFDPLEIEPYEIDGKSYPHLYKISGDGVIADAGSTEMNGYLFLTLRDMVYGIYEIGGGVSEKGDYSGKFKSAESKFSLKMVSDEEVRYDCTGKTRP